jgi:hypothetical protein
MQLYGRPLAESWSRLAAMSTQLWSFSSCLSAWADGSPHTEAPFYVPQGPVHCGHTLAWRFGLPWGRCCTWDWVRQTGASCPLLQGHWAHRTEEQVWDQKGAWVAAELQWHTWKGGMVSRSGCHFYWWTLTPGSECSTELSGTGGPHAQPCHHGLQEW